MRFGNEQTETLEYRLEKVRPPDVVEPDGTQIWLDNEGRPHRDLDLPAIIRADGTREWYQRGELHRTTTWWTNGSSYDYASNPAVIRADGTQEYWKHGTSLSGREVTRPEPHGHETSPSLDM